MFIKRVSGLILSILFILSLNGCGGGNNVGYGIELNNDDGKVVISNDVRPLPFFGKMIHTSTGAEDINISTPLIDGTKIPIVVFDLSKDILLNSFEYNGSNWVINVRIGGADTYEIYLFSDETNIPPSTTGYGGEIYAQDGSVIFSTNHKYFAPITFAEMNITRQEAFNVFDSEIPIPVPYSNTFTPTKLGMTKTSYGWGYISQGNIGLFISPRIILNSENVLEFKWVITGMAPDGIGDGDTAYIFQDLTQSIPILDLSLYD